MESGVKYKIGADIVFEARGDAELVERERKVFLEHVLPLAIEALSFPGPLESVTDISTKSNDENKEPAERVKTRIEDCRKCWCNTCAILEKCIYEDKNEPDGHLFPCEGCTNGIRYMPRVSGEKCPCTGYVQGEENNA